MTPKIIEKINEGIKEFEKMVNAKYGVKLPDVVLKKIEKVAGTIVELPLIDKDYYYLYRSLKEEKNDKLLRILSVLASLSEIEDVSVSINKYGNYVATLREFIDTNYNLIPNAKNVKPLIIEIHIKSYYDEISDNVVLEIMLSKLIENNKVLEWIEIISSDTNVPLIHIEIPLLLFTKEEVILITNDNSYQILIRQNGCLYRVYWIYYDNKLEIKKNKNLHTVPYILLSELVSFELEESSIEELKKDLNKSDKGREIWKRLKIHLAFS